MPEKLDVAVLSITGVDVVLSTVPSFAHHVVGTHSRRARRHHLHHDITSGEHSDPMHPRTDTLAHYGLILVIL